MNDNFPSLLSLKKSSIVLLVNDPLVSYLPDFILLINSFSNSKILEFGYLSFILSNSGFNVLYKLSNDLYTLFSLVRFNLSGVNSLFFKLDFSCYVLAI